MSTLAVWIFRTDCSESECEPLLNVLSDDERKAAGRYRLARDRVRSIVCHAHLRLLLAARASVGPRELAFVVNPFGKPRIESPAAAIDIQFNLSHSGSYGAIATADRAADVGVDIEAMVPLPGYEELARIYLSRDERQWVGTLAPPLRRRAFYRLWTVKEAVVKAHGAGVSLPLREIQARFIPNGGSYATHRARRWRVVELDSIPGCAGAAALEDRFPLTDALVRSLSTSATISWCNRLREGEVCSTSFDPELHAQVNYGR